MDWQNSNGGGKCRTELTENRQLHDFYFKDYVYVHDGKC